MGCHTPRRFPYTTPPELRGAGGRLYPVVIVGAGKKSSSGMSI